MSDDVKELLERVLTWSPERQADVAEVVKLMEEQDALRLTDQQIAEIRRRRANKNPDYLSLAEARKRYKHSGE